MIMKIVHYSYWESLISRFSRTEEVCHIYCKLVQSNLQAERWLLSCYVQSADPFTNSYREPGVGGRGVETIQTKLQGEKTQELKE